MSVEPVQMLEPSTEDVLGRFAAAEAHVAALEAEGTRHDIAVPGGTLAWRVWGRGPPIVLVHGGAGSWTHWIRNIRPLSARYRVLVPDLPGFGDSILRPMPSTADDLADLVETTLTSVLAETTPVHVAAFSFGGVVSSRWAARYPRRFRSFTLLGAVGLGVTRSAMPDFARYDSAMPLPERWATQRRNLGLMMIGDPGRIDDLAIYLQDWNLRRTRLRSRPISLLNLLAGTLPRIECPIRVAWGGRDALYPADTSERIGFLQSLTPPVEPVFIEGAGHWLLYEAADTVNRLLLQLDGPAKASRH